MPRTMTEVNTSVFSRLLESISDDYGNYHLIDNSIQRNINREGDDENWLKDAKIINRVPCHLEKEVLAIEFENSKYLVFYDENPNFLTPFTSDVIKKEDLNAGLLTVLYSEEGNVTLNLGHGYEDELVNNIFGIENDRIDVSVVSQYFNSLELWQIDDSVDLLNNNELYKFYSCRLLSEPDKLSLKFTSDTLIAIKSLLENKNAVILSDKIFNALSSIHWVQAFLEFYRCVEFLYRIPYITEFHGALQSYDSDGGIMLKVAQGLDKLSWKKNEDQAIVNLYGYFDDLNSKLRLHQSLFVGEIPDADQDIMSKRLAKGLYNIRNRLVHWRKDSDRVIEGQYDWNALITELCIFLDQKYDFYSYEIETLSRVKN